MKIKYKIFMALFVITILVFGSGITYSIFTSGATLLSNQEIAKFIFNTEQIDHIDVPLIDINPGEKQEYTFAVSNTIAEKLSNVTVEYELTIKTYHLMPLEIKLMKINEEGETVYTLNCEEAPNSRNANNELVCNSEAQIMGHDNKELDNYVLSLSFPAELNDASYSNLVDYITLDITSWQKLG